MATRSSSSPRAPSPARRRSRRRHRTPGTTVGILKSDEFSSLNAGYWVVFSGEYATKSEAEDALDSLKSSYSDAYVRKVTPSF